MYKYFVNTYCSNYNDRLVLITYSPSCYVNLIKRRIMCHMNNLDTVHDKTILKNMPKAT